MAYNPNDPNNGPRPPQNRSSIPVRSVSPLQPLGPKTDSPQMYTGFKKYNQPRGYNQRAPGVRTYTDPTRLQTYRDPSMYGYANTIPAPTNMRAAAPPPTVASQPVQQNFGADPMSLGPVRQGLSQEDLDEAWKRYYAIHGADAKVQQYLASRNRKQPVAQYPRNKPENFGADPMSWGPARPGVPLRPSRPVNTWQSKYEALLGQQAQTNAMAQRQAQESLAKVQAQERALRDAQDQRARDESAIQAREIENQKRMEAEAHGGTYVDPNKPPRPRFMAPT